MTGKPGKSLLTTWHDDAQQSIDQLWDEIEARFGICPSFFKLAQYEPPIARNLFRQAEFAYLDNPMPAHFKERLFTWLSRFCEVRYCVARHCAFLLGHSRVAGDASAPPLSAEQALALLKELMPDKKELPEYLRALKETPAPLGDWPDFDSDLGRRFRVACAVVFLGPGHAAPWLWELRRLLGPQRYEQLMLFLAFVRTAHFWTEVHPELAFEPDLEAMLREHESIAEALRRGEGEAVHWELGQRLYDEMQSLRESQKNIEALRDSEARFRTIFENAAVGIARVAPDGRFLEVNQRLCDIVGYTRDELVTKNFSDITHPDDLEADLEQRRRLLASEIDTYLREKRYYRKDGSIMWVNLSVSLLRKADGSPEYFISVIEDFSERKRAEEALRESESRFRQLAESLPQLVWTCRAEGPCDYVSPQWVDYTGIPEDEQLGFGWLQQLHPDDREPVITAWKQTVANDTTFEVEFRLRRNDGVYRWFKTRAVALRGSDGKIIKWFGANMDINDQKQAEQSLRESKERLAGIVSSAMDAIITVDEDQRVVLFNEAAERMFGCPAAEAMGQPLNRFIPDRFRGAHTEHVRRFGETGGTSRAMGRLSALAALRADGTEFPIEAAISSIEIGGRRLYTVIHRDITERKRAEAEREQLAQEQVARAAAEAANRSKDEFLAMVSHELRSPLNAILGYTRMLRSGPVDRDAISNVTAVVERSAKAQLQIIEDLLDSARIITGKLRIEMEPIDLVPVLESALDTVRAAAEAKGITLVANFGPAPEETLGDSTRLQQVVWNLLTNAVKFTPESGRIELRMEGAADNIRITVSDTGEGIEPDFLPFVFDRFRQADPSSARRVGGLGLGLSLVKHLVELHGGTITAASEGVGRGSTFTVMLPRRRLEFIAPPTPAVAPREARTEGAITMERDLSLEGVSVLVVDDEEDARELLIEALSEYGAQVTAVSSGAEALAFLSNPPGGKRPDALILDIAMPDEDGYAALKRVRALEAKQGAAADQIPAVALTAYGRSEDRFRALQAGFHMHVAKPVEPAELAVVIASLTTRRAWERGRKE